ncbi:TonB-dependent receptor [Flavobacterium terrae]|uniref:Outer membrane receptor for ferrienterochelin and colicins n=1 Tax=Flavobacterium terrae TaxID=415425 RepID=A0A1M6AKG7_9FLAO|nr:TonB-dependent receptor [Flavobacterium terrae]SHI37009.1 outer membrane receptor for ferrienterochelin and colicins [Flavobacterium terrae]
MKKLILVAIVCLCNFLNAQTNIKGTISSDGISFDNVEVTLDKTIKTKTDIDGNYYFEKVNTGNHEVVVMFEGFQTQKKRTTVKDTTEVIVNFELIPAKSSQKDLEEVVVTGTLKPVSRLESAVPVEVFKPTFFKKNPTSNIFEALQNVNGVRPQLNCNVCNTGDIHINGLEGPYTLVLIDGMPIVSGLSTVYGLSGIPNSLLERIEVVKGPASSLYGSEAVGGLINIITKNPKNAPAFSVDGFSTGWGEANLDLGVKTNLGNTASVLTGINYFNYSNPIDNNDDNFTDVTLQDRISVFQKWNFNRKSKKLFSMAGRYFYEDRWGGEMQWNKSYRGGSEVYGESIYTSRYEVLGAYELPVKEKLLASFSYTNHDQNSVYGNTPYLAKQKIGFGQLTWDKKIKSHDFLFGTAIRYQLYDDNTPATVNEDITWIPSLFVQDEMHLAEKHSLLLGARYDYNNAHGNIFTPRLAYKWKVNDKSIFRFNTGTGFRVVNLFTEEHAALTGSRDVMVLEDLKPERSYNANLNFLKKFYLNDGSFIGVETTAWYTYFTNSILPDYDTNPNQIIYKNLDGFAVSKGISANIDVILGNGIKATLGASYLDVSKTENQIKTKQVLTENFSGTWSISYSIPKWFLSIDYTGNLYGPMKLPLLGNLDPRKQYSSTYSVQNIQFTISKIKNCEVYFGVKNLLNWTPNKGNPFIIARSHDPFDENVQFDSNGNAQVTPENPYGLTFDPSYVYGPNQGIRSFIGLRYFLN